MRARHVPLTPTSSVFSFSGFGTRVRFTRAKTRRISPPTTSNPPGTAIRARGAPTWTAGRRTGSGPLHSAIFGHGAGISEQFYDNTYRPHVEWANLKYQFTPEFGLRVGRTVLPTFMLSDTRKVGYSNPWVRTPVEIYNLVPMTNSDGVDASYDVHLGGFVHRVSGSYGGGPRDLITAGRSGTGDVGAVGHNRIRCATAHVSYSQALDLNVTCVNAIFAGFGSSGLRAMPSQKNMSRRTRLRGSSR